MSNEFLPFKPRTYNQQGIILKVELDHADMQQVTGRRFMARAAIKSMVEKNPQDTYQRVVSCLASRGSLPGTIREEVIDGLRPSNIEVAVVGYTLVEPCESNRRTLGDIFSGRFIDVHGRHIAEYVTEWSSET